MLGTIAIVSSITIILFIGTLRFLIVRGGRGIQFQDPLSFILKPNTLLAEAICNPDGLTEISWERANASQIFRKETTGSKQPILLSQLEEQKSFTDQNLGVLQRQIYTIHFEDGSTIDCATRVWELPGIINLRDLGGYTNKDGKQTVWGKIYRTGHLGSVTDNSLKLLAAHSIEIICDLRSLRERNDLPDRIPEGTKYLQTSIYEEDQLSAIFPKLLFNRASLADQLGAGYIRMLDERATRFGEIIELIAGNLPAMFHCTAGKDRAGLTAAMILSLLNVPRKTIIADYTLSNLASNALFHDFMSTSAPTIERFGIPPDQLRPLFSADPKWMQSALKHLDKNYGGVESYLLEQGKLSKDAVEFLRHQMLK